ncbi:hypothetical protein [Nostoc sp.]|uniref:hypothetical protein n=1 Tax=Nostoc sp. TaxID=1180 RepID=UPI002FF65690
MQLQEFSLLSPVVESGTLLKALKTAIPSEAIKQAMPTVVSELCRTTCLRHAMQT